MRAIILAGGKGTRLLPLTETIPKPMVMICGKPLLQYQIELLKDNGITEITLIVNYLGEKIKDYFQDGTQLGVNIDYIFETEPLGTAGTIGKLAENLHEDFLVLYGDLLLNTDLKALVKFHKKHKGIGTLVVHPNNHPEDSDLLELSPDSIITAIHSKPHSNELIYHNLVNAAIYILNPKISNYIPKDVPSDFGKDIFPKLILDRQKLYGYRTHEYIKDIGTIKRLHEAESDIEQGHYGQGSRITQRKAIFIDRDGVINKEMDNVVKLNDVSLIDQSAQAIKSINNSQYLAIVISNQPQAAKGLCDVAQIDKIIKKVETLLGSEGAYLDGIYTCLHHPDKGFEGENPAYKIICECRKPKTGMIKSAAQDFNIDLSQSYMIGDTTTDALTAKNAGIKFIGVKTGYGCKDGKHRVDIGQIVSNIKEATSIILEEST